MSSVIRQFLSLVLIGAPSLVVSAQSSLTGLQIVIIEGEDAVNVIQQKSAVAPVIEVRDRNDQPVSGVVVRFAIRAGRASFNGSRTLSVTTNAAGRAAAAGLTPTGSGALQITASATLQGQTAAVTIAQTNVMTVAQAAAVSSGTTSGVAGGGSAASGTTGAASGGAGSAGGGLSATTVGIVGGAAAGGAIVAKEVVGGPPAVSYSGPFSGTFTDRFGGCTRIEAHSGTFAIALKTENDGTVSGDVNMNATSTGLGGSNCPASTLTAVDTYSGSGKVKGTTTNMTFAQSHAGLFGTTFFYDFSGALSNGQIGGTFTLKVTHTDGSPDFIAPFSVTLTKQAQQ